MEKLSKQRDTPLVAIFLTTVLLWATSIIGSVASEAGEAPETIEIGSLQKLYGPVVFDHALHMESYGCEQCHHRAQEEETDSTGTCRTCHGEEGQHSRLANGPKIAACPICHVNDAGVEKNNPGTGHYHTDTPGLLGAYHLQCLGCHALEGAITGCQDCHDFSREGLKRFYVLSSQPNQGEANAHQQK